jgi:plastocyanin
LRLNTRHLVMAAVCSIAVGVPALAYGRQDTPEVHPVGTDPYFTWSSPDITIAPGDTVAFNNPSNVLHDAKFDKGSPSCTGLPSTFKKQWSGSCRFDAPGDYHYFCELHATMTGEIHVVAAATPTPTATAPAGASPTPTPTAGPGTGTGGSGGTTETQSTLAGAVTIARSQTGTRVRGSVNVKVGGSRLEVSLLAPRNALFGGKSRKLIRIGRSMRASAPAGKVSFAVGTDAKARSALRRHRRLSVTVNIALTPPGGHKLTHSVRSTLRAG